MAATFASLDLERRLREVPTDAMVRGIFFDLICDHVRGSGSANHPEWVKLRRGQRRAYRLYPVRDFLVILAIAGSLVNADAREGIRDIFSQSAKYSGNRRLFPAFVRLLQPDPRNALGWLAYSRHHLANYGEWRIEKHGAEHATIHLLHEYVWIETAHRGGCEGLLRACGATGRVDVELDGPFQGRLEVRWTVRSSSET